MRTAILILAMVFFGIIGCGDSKSPDQTPAEKDLNSKTKLAEVIPNHPQEIIVGKKLVVKPLGPCAQMADVATVPLMLCLSGALERPQGTHFWNNTKLQPEDIAYLDPEGMVHCPGNPNAGRQTFLGIPIFHIPILGGWRDYVVLEPATPPDGGWHVGWSSGGAVGVSRIRLQGRVRMLLGPGEVSFFGVTAEGDQVPLQQIDTGRIGDGGQYKNEPLL